MSLCECLVIKDLQKQRISFDSHKYAPPFFCFHSGNIWSSDFTEVEVHLHSGVVLVQGSADTMK